MTRCTAWSVERAGEVEQRAFGNLMGQAHRARVLGQVLAREPHRLGVVVVVVGVLVVPLVDVAVGTRHGNSVRGREAELARTRWAPSARVGNME